MKCYMTVGAPGSPAGGIATGWEVVITEWALDSYLRLKHAGTFSDQEYWDDIRPDVELLRDGAPGTHAKFQSSKFWGPAKDAKGVLPNGFKMKWHQVGQGKVQLRLPIMAGSRGGAPAAFLCEAYVKGNAKVEQRKMARFKVHMNLISVDRYTYRGQI
jgi:hypothetical protein